MMLCPAVIQSGNVSLAHFSRFISRSIPIAPLPTLPWGSSPHLRSRQADTAKEEQFADNARICRRSVSPDRSQTPPPNALRLEQLVQSIGGIGQEPEALAGEEREGAQDAHEVVEPEPAGLGHRPWVSQVPAGDLESLWCHDVRQATPNRRASRPCLTGSTSHGSQRRPSFRQSKTSLIPSLIPQHQSQTSGTDQWEAVTSPGAARPARRRMTTRAHSFPNRSWRCAGT